MNWAATIARENKNFRKSKLLPYLNIIVLSIPASIRKSLILGFDFLEFYVGKNLMSILG